MFYENDEATVRYIGRTCLGPGLWLGIEFRYPGVCSYKLSDPGSHHSTGVVFVLQASRLRWNRTDFYSSIASVALLPSNQSGCQILDVWNSNKF